MGDRTAALTETRTLARSTVWNFVGAGAPLFVAIFTIPVLVSGLGTERFGLLALVWVAIGYFSLFDVGLGRALTKLVADRLGTERPQGLPELVWTASFLMLALGVVGGVVVGFLSSPLVNSLKTPLELQEEARQSFLLVAVAIPFVVSTAGWRGVLEAYQRFDLIAAIRVPMGIFTFAAPVAALPFSRSLATAVAILVAGRIVAWAAYLLFVFRVVPEVRREVRFARRELRPLLTFGGWMTVSNLISPLMVYLDRFLIGILLSAAAVTYYATPYEVVTRFLLVPNALLGVLFPAFAISLVRDSARVARMFGKGVSYTLLLLVPVTVGVVALAPEGLDLWLGRDFVVSSTFVLRWLVVGVLANAVGRLVFSLIQAAGRPDLTAKLHVVELCLYLPGVWWMIGRWGINGAAMAWTARMVVDAALLLATVSRLLPDMRGLVVRIALGLGVGIFASVGAGLFSGLWVRAGYLVAVLAIFVPVAWFLVLGSEERATVRALAR